MLRALQMESANESLVEFYYVIVRFVAFITSEKTIDVHLSTITSFAIVTSKEMKIGTPDKTRARFVKTDISYDMM